MSFEVDAKPMPIAMVITSPCKLKNASSLKAGAIARMRVSKVVAALIGVSRSVLNQRMKTIRFLRCLAKKIDATLLRDFEMIECIVQILGEANNYRWLRVRCDVLQNFDSNCHHLSP